MGGQGSGSRYESGEVGEGMGGEGMGEKWEKVLEGKLEIVWEVGVGMVEEKIWEVGEGIGRGEEGEGRAEKWENVWEGRIHEI